MNNKPSILEETIQAAYNPDACATQLNKGLEQVVEVGNISMKLAAKQSSFFLNAITKALTGSLLPNPFGFDLGGPALEGCVAMQKKMLDMALQQSTAVMEAIQESGNRSEFSNMIQQSLNTAQKEITELAANPLNSAAKV